MKLDPRSNEISYHEQLTQYYGVDTSISDRTCASLLGNLDEQSFHIKNKELAYRYMKTNLKLSFSAYKKQPLEGFIIHFSQIPEFSDRCDLSIEDLLNLDPRAQNYTTIQAYIDYILSTNNIDRFYFYRNTPYHTGVSYGFSPEEIRKVVPQAK